MILVSTNKVCITYYGSQIGNKKSLNKMGLSDQPLTVSLVTFLFILYIFNAISLYISIVKISFLYNIFFGNDIISVKMIKMISKLFCKV